MVANEYKPLIVQGDGSLLLDVHDPGFVEARSYISPFAELEKSPEHMHTYRITPLSLWNAASAGLSKDTILERLSSYSRYPVPSNIEYMISDLISRFGVITLEASEDDEKTLYLKIKDNLIKQEIEKDIKHFPYLTPVSGGFYLPLLERGRVKQKLLTRGYPVEDLAPLKKGDPLIFKLRKQTRQGRDFILRDYQIEARDSFYGMEQPGNGFGTMVLPCGAGKTVIGLSVMERYQTKTLILAPNVASVHQWIDEILDKTDLTEEHIGEYSGDKKEIKPITIATYQILVWRKDKTSDFPHFDIFLKANWGLVIYDEVHLLPAPVFRVTAEIQAMKRLGLTATLIREDGAEEDVFSLVGPKRYDVPWKELEAKGFIAEANCYEIRIDLPETEKPIYAISDQRKKYRIAAENQYKIPIVKNLVDNHKEDSILIIGQYLNQLQAIAKYMKAPLITGKTSNKEREVIYNNFRAGKIRVLVVSKVANFAINLPDASVAIQVSGSFGSRQEEAQRLGRILRPKEKNSFFYTIISRYTIEETYGMNRQKFLAEQGYKYKIDFWDTKELI
ncbi:DNA repair helicase XPB [Spirochaeta cellobiosiphila]|uniref:DNA repair helicase XPB n=1 Tax=Spirochaeta cellobiosiphila TaxID=504483 RepID=UPI0004049B88|nr:DNA repair helicase XPB [Spirochaeta cellobiosiphila]